MDLIYKFVLPETLTVEWMKFNSFDEGLINFVKNNGLEGFPLAKIYAISGDYLGLKRALEDFRSMKGIVVETGPSSAIVNYESFYYAEIDNNARSITRTKLDDIIDTSTYLEDGRLVESKGPDGKMLYRNTYDANGNLITAKRRAGFHKVYEYDEKDRVTRVVGIGSVKFQRVYTYGDDDKIKVTLLLLENGNFEYSRYMDNGLTISVRKGNLDEEYKELTTADLLELIETKPNVVIDNEYIEHRDGRGNLIWVSQEIPKNITKAHRNFEYYPSGQLKAVTESVHPIMVFPSFMD